VIGAGFLVGEKLVLSCAHVIARALNLPDNSLDAPLDEVSLDFPLLAPHTILTARVVYWRPLLEDSGDDIAGLIIQDDLPSGTWPVSLVMADELWDHSFRAFGFPMGYDSGVWASGLLRERQATGWIQVEQAKQVGYKIEPGFSGSPIWDELLYGIVGMVVAADVRPEVKTAFIIPADTLVRVWPLLGDEAIRHDENFHLFALDVSPIALVEEGDRAFGNCEYIRSLELYKRALLQFMEQEGGRADASGVISTLERLARAYHATYRNERAKHTLKSIIAHKQANNSQRASAYIRLARICGETANYWEALEYCDRAVEIADGENIEIQFDAYLEKLVAHRTAKEIWAAERVYQLNLLPLWDKLDDFRKALMLNQNGHIAWEAQNWESARSSFFNAEELLNTVPTTRDSLLARSDNCFGLASTHFFRREYAETRRYVEQFGSYGHRLRDKRIIGESFNFLGITCMELGDYEKAIQLQEKAIQLEKEVENNEELANSYFHLAELYTAIGNVREAERLFRQCAEICFALKITRTGPYWGLGLSAYLSGAYTRAKDILRRGIVTAQNTRRLFWQARLYDALAIVLIDLDEIDEAMWSNDQAAQVWSRMGNKEYEPRYALNLARCKLQQGNSQAISDLLELAEKTLESCQATLYSAETRLLLAELMMDCGSADLALTHANRALAFHEQVSGYFEGITVGLGKSKLIAGRALGVKGSLLQAEAYLNQSVRVFELLGLDLELTRARVYHLKFLFDNGLKQSDQAHEDLKWILSKFESMPPALRRVFTSLQISSEFFANANNWPEA